MDEKLNSLYQQGLLYYFMREGDFYLSKNNRTQTKSFGDSIVSYAYECVNGFYLNENGSERLVLATTSKL
jgi:hypothetical protein